MSMVKIKVSEATGKALDWLVAKCEGLKTETWHTGAITVLFPDAPRFVAFNPSTNWAQGGPIKTRELIATAPQFLAAGYQHPTGKWVWRAHLLGQNNLDANHEQEHESELVASMRCYVASKLGDEAEVPEELL